MLKRKKQIIAKVMATTMLASTLAVTFTTTNVSAAETKSLTVSSSKISGADRYKTAVAISKQIKPSTANNAIVVNGQKGVVDAITATPYASLKDDAPILMTQNNKLNADTKAELKRLQVKNVDIIGGTASVSDSVKKEIEAMGIKVNRIAGATKYETGLKVAKEIGRMSDITEVAVASSDVLADPVSIAAPAAQNEIPIILASPKNGLDKATKDYLNSESISKSYIVGGSSSVSNTTQSALPGTKVRLDGGNRPDTNAEIIDQFYKDTNLGNIYVAKSGQVIKEDEIVDALAVGVLAAKYEEPVMLVGKSLSSGQRNLLEDKEFSRVTEIGDGISASTISAIKDTQDISSGGSTSGDTINADTVSELEDALDDASNGDVINFDPYSTVSQSITLRTTKDITVNLEGSHSGNITVDMERGTLNIKDDIDATVYAEDIEKINVNSGVTVDRMQIQSEATDAIISVRGTVRTLDVSASSVEIIGNGNINTLNKRSDTDTSDFDGKIGSTDSNTNTATPVSQVKVQNAKEIVVKFDRKLDIRPTAVVSKNGSAVTGLTSELSDDKMSMTITASAKDVSFAGSYDIKISNMKKDGKLLDNYTTTVIADDTTAPYVSGIVFNQDTNKFEITLSEPIDNTNGLALRLNNTSYEGAVSVSATTNKIMLDRSATNIQLGDNVSVYIAGIKDAAGNLMKAYNGSVSVSKQDLTINATKQVANDKIRITFNKALVATPTKTAINVYKSGDTKKVNIIKDGGIEKVASDTTGRSYDLNISDVFGTSSTSQTVYVELSANTCTDTTGVSNKAYTTSLSMTKDKTKPTISSVAVSSDKGAVEVTMSEPITAITESKISLRKNSVGLTPVTATLKSGTENVLVVKTSDTEGVNTDGTLKGGNYQVHFESGAFTDLSNIAVDSLNTNTVVVSESTTSTTLEVTIAPVTDKDNEFKITAPTGEKFKYSSLSNTNFMLDGKTIPTNSNVRFGSHDYTTILVTLPEEYVDFTGKAMLKTTGLRLESDKSLKDREESVDVVDNKAPVLQNVELVTYKDNSVVTGYDLKLNFNENVEFTGDVSTMNALLKNIEIKYGNTTYAGNSDACKWSINEKDHKQVIIHLNSGTNFDNVAAYSYTPTFEITSDIDTIRDVDSIKLDDTYGIKAKKDIKVNISKSTITTITTK